MKSSGKIRDSDNKFLLAFKSCVVFGVGHLSKIRNTPGIVTYDISDDFTKYLHISDEVTTSRSAGLTNPFKVKLIDSPPYFVRTANVFHWCAYRVSRQ